MWICQVRALLQEKPSNPAAPVTTQAPFPLPLTYCIRAVGTRSWQCKSCVLDTLAQGNLGLGIHTTWKACEGECKRTSKGYPLHSPPTRQNTVMCASRQKTWTVPSRSSCEVRQISAMAQSSWLPSCFRKWWVWEAISKKGPFPRLHQELENQTKKRIVCSLPKPAALAFHAPCLWICSGVSPGWKEIEASMTNAALILPLLPLAPFQRGIKLIPCWFVTLAL